MSTGLEAIAARHAGLEVLGISLVTNTAAGISPGAGMSAAPLDHAEVVAAGQAAGRRCGSLLAQVVPHI
jgi:purine-nucleoside phosphorylase